MSELFNKRMGRYLGEGKAGAAFVRDSNLIDDKMFIYDQAYKKGIIYDWEMNPIEEVEFKLGKTKVFEPEAYHVEYWVQFKSGHYPEIKHKELYYKNDGRERFGFYIDVPDYEENVIEKWLIVGKDDKVAFDRYMVYKCNYCFEWVHDGIYYNCVGVIRDKNDNATNDVKKNRSLGGTSVYDDISIFVPSCLKTHTLILGTRLIISDNEIDPHVYEIVDNKDSVNIGVDKIYFTRCLFNFGTDFIGTISDFKKYDFNISNEITTLPDGFGGDFHKICNIIDSKLPEIIDDSNEEEFDITQIELSDVPKYLYVDGTPITIKATNCGSLIVGCHIFIDSVEYSIKDLEKYFEINIEENMFTIKAINKNMVKYIVKIAIYDDARSYYKFVEMEVSR